MKISFLFFWLESNKFIQFRFHHHPLIIYIQCIPGLFKIIDFQVLEKENSINFPIIVFSRFFLLASNSPFQKAFIFHFIQIYSIYRNYCFVFLFNQSASLEKKIQSNFSSHKKKIHSSFGPSPIINDEIATFFYFGEIHFNTQMKFCKFHHHHHWNILVVDRWVVNTFIFFLWTSFHFTITVRISSSIMKWNEIQNDHHRFLNNKI